MDKELAEDLQELIGDSEKEKALIQYEEDFQCHQEIKTDDIKLTFAE
jgi:hypothetical protein